MIKNKGLEKLLSEKRKEVIRSQREADKIKNQLLKENLSSKLSKLLDSVVETIQEKEDICEKINSMPIDELRLIFEQIFNSPEFKELFNKFENDDSMNMLREKKAKKKSRKGIKMAADENHTSLTEEIETAVEKSEEMVAENTGKNNNEISGTSDADEEKYRIEASETNTATVRYNEIKNLQTSEKAKVINSTAPHENILQRHSLFSEDKEYSSILNTETPATNQLTKTGTRSEQINPQRDTALFDDIEYPMT